ncbi:hypothetical protein ACFXKI_34510 [Streptomyces mirabilis]|uniref:hypothetical protein n=1 Tax=Streptomyces mirabilis TaxID=68239 RepID=UPI0036C329E0
MTTLPQPSGSWLLAAGNGTGMRLWDPLTGRLVHSLLTAAPVTNIVNTAGDAQRVHIAGPARLATLGGTGVLGWDCAGTCNQHWWYDTARQTCQSHLTGTAAWGSPAPGTGRAPS